MRFPLATALLLAASATSLYAQKPLLTEDFESGKIDPAIWEIRAKGAPTMAVEPADGAHGKFALHIHYPDMERNAYTFIVATHLPDSIRTHYFGRAYMKVTPTIAQSHNPLIFTGEPGWPLSKFQEIGTYKGTWQPSYQENKSLAGQGGGEQTFHADSGPPLDKWFLLEWEFSDNPTTIAMWVDGEKVMSPVTTGGEKTDVLKFTWPKVDGKTADLAGGYQEFGIGMRAWQNPTPAMDVYYDDIAIGASRIGPVK